MNPELLPYETMAKEIMRRCMAEDEPTDINAWIAEQIARLGGGDTSAIMDWAQSFDYTDAMLIEYERIANTPADELRLLDWPWKSWNNLIDPLELGMLAIMTAPDGQGKTIYAESVAEYWAHKRNKVAFVHFELNRKLMMLRRLSRHTGIDVRTLKSGKMTSEQARQVNKVKPMLTSWDGQISYLHTPGWSMERTIAELRRLHAEGLCDVVVIDYLEKAGVSQRQLKMFGANGNMREADNVEQIKNFCESTEVPALMVAQMRKDAKEKNIDNVSRTGMRGAGEKSDKSNLVVLIMREWLHSGNYSNTVDVRIDKNTMGGTGKFQQVMQPEFFRVGDMAYPRR